MRVWVMVFTVLALPGVGITGDMVAITDTGSTPHGVTDGTTHGGMAVTTDTDMLATMAMDGVVFTTRTTVRLITITTVFTEITMPITGADVVTTTVIP
jgi:hypothetical protein